MLRNFTCGNRFFRVLSGLIVVSVFLFSVQNGNAQGTTDHASDILAFSRGEMAKLITAQSGDMTSLLHGRRFQAQYPFVRGMPFWFSGVWLYGNIQTPKYVFRNIPIQYDAYKDALIYFPDSFSLDMVMLNPIQIVAFETSGMKFVYLGRGPEKDAMDQIRLSPGYFELYYQGKTLLLAKRTKALLTTSDNTETSGRFAARTAWYIVREGAFYEVGNNRDIFSLFADQKELVKPYWREHHIRDWTRNPDLLAKFLRYCDQL